MFYFGSFIMRAHVLLTIFGSSLPPVGSSLPPVVCMRAHVLLTMLWLIRLYHQLFV